MAREPRSTLVQASLFVAIFTLVQAHPHFQLEIPNGDRIQHPCDVRASVWRGVGHRNPLGGGALNNFGKAFAASDFKWTEALCRVDSDGDGLTNGEELGDPQCQWTPGSEVSQPPTSHPGICEPVDDPKCVDQNGFLSCYQATFECDVVNEPETTYIEKKVPAQLPAGTSSLTCLDFELPFEEQHHLVGSMPVIDRSGPEMTLSIHVYACANGPSRPLDSPYACETESMACQDLIAVWRRGMTGECHNPDVGVPIGGEKGTGYRYATIQMLRSTLELTEPRFDQSGVRLFVTSRLRAHQAGYFYFGPRYLALPPGRTLHSVRGGLDARCTREVLQGNVRVLTATSQMHRLGRAQETTLVRDGNVTSYLAVDEQYSWIDVQPHRFREGVEVLPGDELFTTCKYDTSTEEVTKFWGESVMDEKCYAYIMYYPKENILSPHFTSWGGMSYCEMKFGTVQGCDLRRMKNLAHADDVSIRRSVKEKCRPGTCLRECLDYVRDVKKTACFHGDANTYLRTPINLTLEERLEHVTYYAALDSCDVQLTRELAGCDVMPSTGTCTAVLHVGLIYVALVAQELLVLHFYP